MAGLGLKVKDDDCKNGDEEWGGNLNDLQGRVEFYTMEATENYFF